MSTGESAAVELSQNTVFEIFSNTRRRMVLYYLRDRGGPVPVEELAAEVAAFENDANVDDLSRQQRKRVYVSLYQTHLPKLEEAGVIDYKDDGIQLTDRARKMDTYLTPCSPPERSWELYYLLVAVVGGLIFGLSQLGIPGAAAIPSLGLGVVLLIAFGLLATIQYGRTRRRQQELPRELAEHEQ